MPCWSTVRSPHHIFTPLSKSRWMSFSYTILSSVVVMNVPLSVVFAISWSKQRGECLQPSVGVSVHVNKPACWEYVLLLHGCVSSSAIELGRMHRRIVGFTGLAIGITVLYGDVTEVALLNDSFTGLRSSFQHGNIIVEELSSS